MKKNARNRFANAVIAVCIIVAAVVTAAVIYEYHRLDTVVPANVVGVLFGFWGGELLIVAMRQVFGSDLPEKMTAAKIATNDGEKI